MIARKKIPFNQQFIKMLSAFFMFLCLFILTGSNFINFPQKEIRVNTLTGSKEKDPSAPVEEKSSSNNNGSIQEEYLHERIQENEFDGTAIVLKYQKLAVEKLQIVHFELLSPPPEFSGLI